MNLPQYHLTLIFLTTIFFFQPMIDPFHTVHLPLHKSRYHNSDQTLCSCQAVLLEILNIKNQPEYQRLAGQNHLHNSKP
jgi:hypothetical protein